MTLFMDKLLNFSLINIDKSAGPTSYSVSEFVRRQLGGTPGRTPSEVGVKKTSHMGTLSIK